MSQNTENDQFDWTEKVSAFWDDLPFLKGVQLARRNLSLAATWLDRVNSYVSYEYVLGHEHEPLILIQPSVACEPLYPVISLIGLLVLDGLTSSRNLIDALRRDEIYEVDGKFRCRFGGLTDLVPGWVSLIFRDGVIYCPASVVRRMVPVAARRLASAKEFSAVTTSYATEPIQRFFNWREAIGLATITARVLLVSSQERATKLFADITSNGIRLFDAGLISFCSVPNASLLLGTPIVIVPTLTVARQFVDKGENVLAIVVDGYERLRRGRHDLPFLLASRSPPSILVWSQKGYFPVAAPGWLGAHRRLDLSTKDINTLLELDADLSSELAPSLKSLTFAGQLNIETCLVAPTQTEQNIVASIKEFLKAVSRSSEFPDYWQYHLMTIASELLSIVEDTPAYWRDIEGVARAWEATFTDEWADLSRNAAQTFAPIRAAHQHILESIYAVTDVRNTKADALISLLDRGGREEWRVVCDYRGQVDVLARLARRVGSAQFRAILLRDLDVCQACIVAGWTNSYFARRLWAHTPRRVAAIVDERESKLWGEVLGATGRREGDSLLEAVGFRGQITKEGEQSRPPATLAVLPKSDVQFLDAIDSVQCDVSCVFIWPSGEELGKIVSRNSRILVESGDNAADKHGYQIVPGDRVILGNKSGRWSPSEEFTQAVVEGIAAYHPDLVRDAKAWRQALRELQGGLGGSVEELKRALDDVGVHRTLITIEGWLRLERAAPIGPQHITSDLTAIWNVIGFYTKTTLTESMTACSQLRSLRGAAGRALIKQWKGETVDAGFDRAWLAELVSRLREQVEVHEVERVSFGTVPSVMVGWWVSDETAANCEKEPDGTSGIWEPVSADEDSEG